MSGILEEVLMEWHREEIEAIVQRTGLTEPEARARYHLREAFAALRDVTDTPAVPEAEPMGPMYALVHVAPHFETLNNLLARRVLERERPEGWGRGESTRPEGETTQKAAP